MSDKQQYYQCRLEEPGVREGAPVRTTTGWIPARGAEVGLYIELLPSRETWKVVEVYEHGLPEDVLKETQRMNRRSLPSVEPIA